MNTQTKTISGRLLDVDSKDEIADVSLEIVAREPHHSHQSTGYFIQAIMQGYKPDITERVYLLELSEKIAGEVFLISHLIKKVDFDTTLSIFNVYLQDTFWLRTKWFESL